MSEDLKKEENQPLRDTVDELFDKACEKHANEDIAGAKVLYGQVLKLHSGHAGAYNNLGLLAKKQGHFSEALAYFQKSLEIMPNHIESLNNLAMLYLPLGSSDKAELIYQKALALAPDSNTLHSNLLMCRQYQVGITAEKLYDAHKAWSLSVATSIVPKELKNTKDPSKKLRLGFVSNGLGPHPVGHFSVGFFENIDKEKFEIYCYSELMEQDDNITNRLKNSADSWKMTKHLSLAQLSKQIEEDEIDILFDLYGHTGANRLVMFAERVAPIQITWAGYVGTTGVQAMDYLMADKFHVPENEEHCYHEDILRMPDGYICYAPPENCPQVGPLPVTKNGYITFGCFNNPAKINDAVLVAWSHILKQMPSSKLILRYKGMDDPLVVERISKMLIHFGIDMERVEFLGACSHYELLDTYNMIDIALDTFPYSGGITTCEALWMGVPVITKPGKTFAGRHSFSHISNAGLTEIIATGTDEYIKIAEKVAKDVHDLSNTRLELRARMSHSPLCDAQKFTDALSEKLRAIWADWCLKQDNDAE